LGPKLKKIFLLCRGPFLALGKGALCRELDKALSKDILFAESRMVWLSAKVTITDAVPGAAPLPSASISAKLAFAEGLALPRAEPSVKALC